MTKTVKYGEGSGFQFGWLRFGSFTTPSSWLDESKLN